MLEPGRMRPATDGPRAGGGLVRGDPQGLQLINPTSNELRRVAVQPPGHPIDRRVLEAFVDLYRPPCRLEGRGQSGTQLAG